MFNASFIPINCYVRSLFLQKQPLMASDITFLIINHLYEPQTKFYKVSNRALVLQSKAVTVLKKCIYISKFFCF